MLANEDYMVRVAAGKKVEAAMIDFLRHTLKWTVELPSAKEDMKDKIDCFVLMEGARYSMQLKFRENAPDIIVEAVKDLDKNLVGRDLQGSAEFYFLLDNQNRGWIYRNSTLKAKVAEISKTCQEELKADPELKNWNGKGWNAKVTVDRNHGNRKLMVFVDKDSLPHLGPWLIPI